MTEEKKIKFIGLAKTNCWTSARMAAIALKIPQPDFTQCKDRLVPRERAFKALISYFSRPPKKS